MFSIDFVVKYKGDNSSEVYDKIYQMRGVTELGFTSEQLIGAKEAIVRILPKKTEYEIIGKAVIKKKKDVIEFKNKLIAIDGTTLSPFTVAKISSLDILERRSKKFKLLVGFIIAAGTVLPVIVLFKDTIIDLISTISGS